MSPETGQPGQLFQFIDPRQKRIYRQLRELVGAGPAEFFRDACRLMEAPDQLQTTSHVVGHLLREIESALRDVLETVAQREDRLQKIKDSGDNHKAEIRGILRGLEIPENDAIAQGWLRLPGKENSYGLHKRAHRDALAFPRPVDHAFRQFWDDIQGIFDIVLERFQARYLGVFRLLDELLTKATPDSSAVEKLKNTVPNNYVAHSYFFDRLEHPGWLEPLRAADFFSRLPSPEVDEETRSIRYSRWPQSGYLARMASRAPEEVLQIMLLLPETDNVWIHHDLAKAAAAMPPEFAAQWCARETAWIEKQDGLFQLQAETLGERVIPLLFQGRMIDTGLKLLKSLLDVLPESRTQEQQTGPGHNIRRHARRIRFSAWQYRRIRDRILNALPPSAREAALLLFCDLLEKAITLARQSLAEEAGLRREDYSYIWFPDLEVDRQSDDPENLLVLAVRTIAHAIASSNQMAIPDLIEQLRQHKYEVFDRLAVDVLCSYPDESLIKKVLTDRHLFEARGVRREYDLLIQSWFGKLPDEDQQTILSWIDIGPDLQAFKEWHQAVEGHEPTDEDIARHKKLWQRDRLAPFHEALPTDWKRRYQEITGEVGELRSTITENERTEIWVGPTSPKTADDLRSMGVDEIVAYLQGWEPAHEPMSPSREGVGRQLTQTVSKEPLRFAAGAMKFQGLDPTYVRALLQGFREALSHTAGMAWSEVLQLCLWVVQQPITIPGRTADKWGDDPDWGWTRKTIAGLLGVGFREGPSMIPLEHRELAWEILAVLTDDPDPTPEDEVTDEGSSPIQGEKKRIDPAHIAINSTRGEAMQTVVEYGLWVRRHLEKQPDGPPMASRGFLGMPEVQRVLEAHLDSRKDPSLAVRSVYGRLFPSLVFLDPRWTNDHIIAIFPHEESLRRYRDAAWDTFLVFCQVSPVVFKILKEEYALAVEQLGIKSTTSLGDQSLNNLAEHLMVFYWLGELDSNDTDGLLARFYARASASLRGHALEFVGRSVQRTPNDLDLTIAARLQALWERRLSKARSPETVEDHAAELEAFGWWFVSGKFEDMWAVRQLLDALAIVPKTSPDHLVIERLVSLAQSMPLEAVQCLGFMVEGDKDGWKIMGWQEDARKIIAVGLSSRSSQARRAAVDLVNRLAARGFTDYRDLLA